RLGAGVICPPCRLLSRVHRTGAVGEHRLARPAAGAREWRLRLLPAAPRPPAPGERPPIPFEGRAGLLSAGPCGLSVRPTAGAPAASARGDAAARRRHLHRPRCGAGPVRVLHAFTSTGGLGLLQSPTPD